MFMLLPYATKGNPSNIVPGRHWWHCLLTPVPWQSSLDTFMGSVVFTIKSILSRIPGKDTTQSKF